MHRDDLLELIRDAGFTPVERDTRYNVLRVFDGPDKHRRDTAQAMPV
jgi:aminodeoxyfutalosine synthase